MAQRFGYFGATGCRQWRLYASKRRRHPRPLPALDGRAWDRFICYNSLDLVEDMRLDMSRTDEAVAWIEAAPEGERRTQAQAALLFGISQPTIAGEIARRRAACPACGQRVKGQNVAEVVPRERLTHVVNTYAWHRSECPVDPCDCGFTDIEREANK